MAPDVEWESWADNSAQRAGVPWLTPRQGRSGSPSSSSLVGSSRSTTSSTPRPRTGTAIALAAADADAGRGARPADLVRHRPPRAVLGHAHGGAERVAHLERVAIEPGLRQALRVPG